jgi:hypothetical protein
MTVDERKRLQLAEAAKRILGEDEGITLMELLPPVGWADVATKHDVLHLETALGARIDAQKHEIMATMDRELRSQTWKLFGLSAATMGAFTGALVAVARF